MDINTIFYEDEYDNAVKYVYSHEYTQIVEIDKDEKGRRFKITETPKPTEEEILEEKKEELRIRRQNECFDILNQNYIEDGKSVTWFDTLNEEQKKEANDWVQAWRDITETFVVPEKPIWLK